MKSPLLETAPKEEEQEEREKKTTSCFQNHLGPKTRETELRLGFSLTGFEDMGSGGGGEFSQRFQTAEKLSGGFVVKQRNGGFGAKRWFSETGDGFESPWTLVAGQQKAVFDQNHQRLEAPPATRAPPVVGWPPVRAFRKNLATQLKPEMETSKSTMPSAEASQNLEGSMFVKVNMEGYAVGRKINLKAHDSYESLSRALQKMFDNFFSINYSKNHEKDEEKDAPASTNITPNYVLIYEDNEGDRMLVGDVPWQMFISGVKRLHIISGSKAPTLVVERAAKDPKDQQ